MTETADECVSKALVLTFCEVIHMVPRKQRLMMVLFLLGVLSPRCMELSIQDRI